MNIRENRFSDYRLNKSEEYLDEMNEDFFEYGLETEEGRDVSFDAVGFVYTVVGNALDYLYKQVDILTDGAPDEFNGNYFRYEPSIYFMDDLENIDESLSDFLVRCEDLRFEGEDIRNTLIELHDILRSKNPDTLSFLIQLVRDIKSVLQEERHIHYKMDRYTTMLVEELGIDKNPASIINSALSSLYFIRDGIKDEQIVAGFNKILNDALLRTLAEGYDNDDDDDDLDEYDD